MAAFEGKNVARAFDPMLRNDKNTPLPVLQGPVITVPDDPVWLVCDKKY
jgi:hypothetical protein